MAGWPLLADFNNTENSDGEIIENEGFILHIRKPAVVLPTIRRGKYFLWSF